MAPVMPPLHDEPNPIADTRRMAANLNPSGTAEELVLSPVEASLPGSWMMAASFSSIDSETASTDIVSDFLSTMGEILILMEIKRGLRGGKKL
jgi:hypothetical protein